MRKEDVLEDGERDCWFELATVSLVCTSSASFTVRGVLLHS